MGDQGWSCNRPAVSHWELGELQDPVQAPELDIPVRGCFFLGPWSLVLGPGSWVLLVAKAACLNSLRQAKLRCNEQYGKLGADISQLPGISVGKERRPSRTIQGENSKKRP